MLVFSQFLYPVQVIINPTSQTTAVLVTSISDLTRQEIYFVTVTPLKLNNNMLNTPNMHITPKNA